MRPRPVFSGWRRPPASRTVALMLGLAVTFHAAGLGAAPAPHASSLRVSADRMGSWLPLRVSPTVSPTATFGSTQVSTYNLARAADQIASLQAEKPVTVVDGPALRVVISDATGLIAAMYPKALRGFSGSYFREYLPDTEPAGSLAVVSSNAVAVALRWSGADNARDIAVHRDGRIDTRWERPPAKALQLISSAHPYPVLAMSTSDVVRFSQLLERKRVLTPTCDRHALFGFEDLSLEVVHPGWRPLTEEIWLDPGELMYEVGRRRIAELNAANAELEGKGDPRRYIFDEMAQLCRTYLGGGAVRVVALEAGDASAAISYRVGLEGNAVLRLSDAPASPVAAAPGPLAGPGPGGMRAGVIVELESVSARVMRVYPNHFNGWKLRPLALSLENPLPAFFPVRVHNRSATAQTVTFSLESGAWLQEAALLWDGVPASIHEWNLRGDKELVFESEAGIGKAGTTVNLSVPAGRVVEAMLRVRAVEETVGPHAAKLKWRTDFGPGEADLTLTVVPDILVRLQAAGYGFSWRNFDMNRHFSSALSQCGVYFHRTRHGEMPAQEQAIRTRYHAIRRKGFLISEIVDLRGYIRARATRTEWGDSYRDRLYQKDPVDFVAAVRSLFAETADLDVCRYRLYTFDELWEILCGYKGQRFMSLPDAATLFETLLDVSRTPSWGSFMIHGVDEGLPETIATDIPQVFFYCGDDRGVAGYAEKLKRQRLKLIERWREDPELMARAGTPDPSPILSFWISARLHQDDYRSVRRHMWWLRQAGFDSIAIWAMGAFNVHHVVYGGTTGDWSAMGTAREDGLILTDRSLAVIDGRRDMQLITLVNLLRRDATGTVAEEVDAALARAFDLAQDNRFDEAAHRCRKAVSLMRPELAYLAGEDYWHPIATEPLPDPAAGETARMEAAKHIPSVRLPVVGSAGRPPPTLDGKLDNAYLEEGAALSPFRLLSGEPAEQQTQVYMTRDTDYLYVFFQCNEAAMDRVSADRTARDDSVFYDDSVEVFIRPDPTQPRYLHFVANLAGVRYDAECGERQDAEWDPDWDVAVSRKTASWSIEIRIPYDSIGRTPEPGETWRANFGRNATPGAETSSWSAAFGSFHDTDRFGRLTF